MPNISSSVLIAAALAVAALASAATAASVRRRRRRGSAAAVDGLVGLIGATPLVELRTLSRATGRRILAKCEFLNPGGSSKDRVARRIVAEAEADGRLRPGGTVVEGTSGSTGISLALVAAARGYACKIVMPDDAAAEKTELLRLFGADVVQVPPASIVNDGHYNNVARRIAADTEGGFYADQFENLANYRAHYHGTGPEIWAQTGGRVDAFVMSAGTGGTLSGVGAYLKERRPEVRVVLADPEGSVLLHRVRHGVAFAPQQAERRLKRHRYDTLTEGIGLDRVVGNFEAGERHVEGGLRVTDQDALRMSQHLLRREGLFVGSSSGVNCVAACRVACDLPPGSTVVTLLCDSGGRHKSKWFSAAYMQGHGLDVGELNSSDDFLAALIRGT